MCIGVVIPSRVGQSASSTSWYIMHTILTYALRSINVNLTTVISTQRPSYALSDPHLHQTTITMAPPWVAWRWPTGISIWTKEICACVLKNTTQDIDAVISQSALTEDLAALQGWITQHDKSTLLSYTNINMYTVVCGVAMMHDKVRKSDADIESLTLSHWHWVTDIESLTLGLWHQASDIESLKLTNIDMTLGDNLQDLLGLKPNPKLNDDDVRTMQRLISCVQRRVARRATPTPWHTPQRPGRKFKTPTSPATNLTTISSPAPKITSAPSLNHILVPPSPPINKCTSDVCVGSTTSTVSNPTSLRPRGDSVTQGSSTTHRGTTRSGELCITPSPTVSPVQGDD